MRDVLEALLQLQELELVLQESGIVHNQQSPDSAVGVEESIAALREQIPPNHLRRYDMLKKNGPGIARKLSGVCSTCRLNVPIGDLNRMRRGDIPWACPNCGRFLLLS